MPPRSLFPLSVSAMGWPPRCLSSGPVQRVWWTFCSRSSTFFRSERETVAHPSRDFHYGDIQYYYIPSLLRCGQHPRLRFQEPCAEVKKQQTRRCRASTGGCGYLMPIWCRKASLDGSRPKKLRSRRSPSSDPPGSRISRRYLRPTSGLVTPSSTNRLNMSSP